MVMVWYFMASKLGVLVVVFMWAWLLALGVAGVVGAVVGGGGGTRVEVEENQLVKAM